MIAPTKQWFFISFFGVFYFFIAIGAANSDITTPGIIQSTLSGMTNCSSYRVEGSCVWLECSLGGCHTHHTPKVRHYVPELLVLTYSESSEIPWMEYRMLKKPMNKIAESVYKNKTGFSLSDGHLEGIGAALQEVSFFEAAVLGNPSLSLLPSYFLKGKASPALSYFDSTADSLLWRGGELEMLFPLSWLELPENMIGPTLSSWGSIYPRTGFIAQTDLSKAAASIAMRALHIVTDSKMSHIAQSLAFSPCSYSDCESPPVINGLNIKTKYQLIFPVRNNFCTTSISNNIALSQSHLGLEGVFIWSVWREYKACLPGSGKFLYSWG